MAFDRLDPNSPQTADDESKMRRSLGLGTAKPSSGPSPASDPSKSARQAIRSQAAAREYVERQLAHAEATIEDLRTKQHHARQERGAAVEAARLATALKIAAERDLIGTRAALTEEKVARERGDRALRDARATVIHLQAKLDAATRDLEAANADLEIERLARQKAVDAMREAIAVQKAAVLPDRTEATETAIPPVRRPVGRPRKVVVEQPIHVHVQPTETPPEPARAASKTATKPKEKSVRIGADKADQEPVQWWVEGWNRRG